jgi:hypothetical protein
MGAVVRDRRFGPQAPHQRHLLVESLASVRELLAERLVFDPVPSEPDTEAKTTPSEQVDLGGLLRREDRLALREDDDAGHELE